MSIRVEQNSALLRRGWWQWSVWLEGPSAELDEIGYVVYTLHSTFVQPVHRIDERSNGFRLNASGWGEFRIYVDVHRRDGQVMKLDHWLTLAQAQSEAADIFGATSAPVSKSVVSQNSSTAEEGSAVAGAALESFAISAAPRVYLSCAVADAALAGAVQVILVAAGFEVITADDIGGVDRLGAMLDDPRQRVQAGIFLITEIRNPWLSREVAALSGAHVRMVSVLVGTAARIPQELADSPQHYIDDVNKLGQHAASIAADLATATHRR